MKGRMGTQPLQRWTSAMGQDNAGLVQQLSAQTDVSAFTELAAMMEVKQFDCTTTANLSLILETAESVDSPDGAWEEIMSTSATTVAHAYASARFDATNHLLRWVRWRIDSSSSGDWNVTFRICVTLR